jgi:hypothetical protein
VLAKKRLIARIVLDHNRSECQGSVGSLKGDCQDSVGL